MKYTTQESCQAAGNLWLSASDFCIVSDGLELSQSDINLPILESSQETAKTLIQADQPPVSSDPTSWFWLLFVGLFVGLLFYLFLKKP